MSTFSKDINESYNIAFCKEVITYQRYFQDQVSYLGISGKTLSFMSSVLFVTLISVQRLILIGSPNQNTVFTGIRAPTRIKAHP